MVDCYPKTISYWELNNMFPGLDILDEDEQQWLARRPEERGHQKMCGILFMYHDSELTKFLRSRKASSEEETMSCLDIPT